MQILRILQSLKQHLYDTYMHDDVGIEIMLYYQPGSNSLPIQHSIHIVPTYQPT